MTNIIVVFPKIEDAKSIKNVLVRNGFSAMAACTTGAQAIGLAEDYTNGIVICGYKLIDMLYSELLDCLPEGMQMLLMASNAYLGEVNLKGAGRDMMCQSMERRRRRQRLSPRERKPEEMALIKEAKCLLMERNHMSEEEAHRYIQKCSMDSSTSMVETAKMVLTTMQY